MAPLTPLATPMQARRANKPEPCYSRGELVRIFGQEPSFLTSVKPTASIYGTAIEITMCHIVGKNACSGLKHTYCQTFVSKCFLFARTAHVPLRQSNARNFPLIIIFMSKHIIVHRIVCFHVNSDLALDTMDYYTQWKIF